MLGIVLPLFGWWLGKNKSKYNQLDVNDGLITVAESQVKTNDMLIEACAGLVRVQQNNLEIQKSMFEQYRQRTIREQRMEIIELIRHCDEQIERYADNPDIKKICLEKKQYFENWLLDFDNEVKTTLQSMNTVSKD